MSKPNLMIKERPVIRGGGTYIYVLSQKDTKTGNTNTIHYDGKLSERPKGWICIAVYER